MDETKNPDIREISLKKLDDFPNHPFKVKDDEAMTRLVESVSQFGVISPAIVTEKSGGRFQIISGHRRKRACELAGLKTMRCEVRELTKEEAIMLMVESNCQREKVLPSEKAFAYKMQMDAMKKAHGRPSLEKRAPVGPFSQEGKTRDKIANNSDESREQIRRYIRLTELIPELLELVDEERIKMRPAVEISYLDVQTQYVLFDAIEEEECTPSHAQTIRMREMSDKGELTKDKVYEIIREEKPNQKDRIIIPNKVVEDYLPRNLPYEDRQEYVCRALKYYSRYRERENLRQKRNREER